MIVKIVSNYFLRLIKRKKEYRMGTRLRGFLCDTEVKMAESGCRSCVGGMASTSEDYSFSSRFSNEGCPGCENFFYAEKGEVC